MKQKHTEALDAFRYLLKNQLTKISQEQKRAAKAKLQAVPSHQELTESVVAWAMALADVCQQRSAKCAEAYADGGEERPAVAAVQTIMLTLSEHLRLPPDSRLTHPGPSFCPRRNGPSRTQCVISCWGCLAHP